MGIEFSIVLNLTAYPLSTSEPHSHIKYIKFHIEKVMLILGYIYEILCESYVPMLLCGSLLRVFRK